MMSIAEFFSGVRTAEHRRRATKGETFEQLALQVADGESLDPDSVVETLDKLGRSAADLESAAGLIADRREWSALLPRDAELHAEHNRLYAEQETATAQHVEAVRLANGKHAARVGAIQQRLAAIVGERDRVQSARNRLLETSPERQRLAKLHDEHAAVAIALQERLPRELRQAKPADVGFCQNAIRLAQAEVDRLSTEIARLEVEALRP